MDKFENTGLAYINFREHSKAVECQRHFSGFSAWPGGHFSERSCRAQWSSIQGYEANIQKQQKLTDWVNSNIPEDCKPMVFDSYGTRLPTMEIFPSWQDFEDSSRVYHGWRNSETHEDHRGWWKDEWYGRNGGNSGGYDAWRNGNAGNATSDWSGSIYKDQWSDRDRSDWRKENMTQIGSGTVTMVTRNGTAQVCAGMAGMDDKMPGPMVTVRVKWAKDKSWSKKPPIPIFPMEMGCGPIPTMTHFSKSPITSPASKLTLG